MAFFSSLMALLVGLYYLFGHEREIEKFERTYNTKAPENLQSTYVFWGYFLLFAAVVLLLFS